MARLSDIKELARAIAREFAPSKIILFGSHAVGAAGSDSDVDLLVLLSFKGKGCRKAVEIFDRLSPAFPVDLLVRTPETFERRVKQGDFFLRRIAAEGVVLYEKPHT